MSDPVAHHTFSQNRPPIHGRRRSPEKLRKPKKQYHKKWLNSLFLYHEILSTKCVPRQGAVPRSSMYVSFNGLRLTDDTIFGLHFLTPATDSQVQANPSLKEKAWHLTWMPLAFLTTLRPQRQPTRFTGEVWVNFFCQALGAPIPLLRAHAVARTQCACNFFVLDQYGDHVLSCNKYTGA